MIDTPKPACDCVLCAPPDRQAIDRKALVDALDRHGIPHNMSDTKEGDVMDWTKASDVVLKTEIDGPSLPCGDLTGAPVGAGEPARPEGRCHVCEARLCWWPSPWCKRPPGGWSDCGPDVEG